MIIAVGVASRFWLIDMPNFKPVAALVLFGGFFFRRALTALIALIGVMFVSDIWLGTYAWPVLLSVYLSLAAAAALGCWIRRSEGQSSKVNTQTLARFTFASVTMSSLFFAFTNGAVWMAGQWYPRTWEGLCDCYLAGVPFYRATLMGDLFFTSVIVAVYAAAMAWAANVRPANPVANSI